jgi:Peptidase family S41/Tricorn protease C1 domain
MSRGTLPFRLGAMVIAAAVSFACGNTRPSPLTPEVLGRWLFTFHIMGGLFRTPVELIADSHGLLRANSLGPPLVHFSRASILARQLRLDGSSRYGAVHVSGRLSSNSFDGQWRIRILRGPVTAARMPMPLSSSAGRMAAFDALHDSLAARYYDPTFGGVNWDSLTKARRRRVGLARSDGEWLAGTRQMLAQLRSSHLDVSAIRLAEAFPTRGGGASTDESKFIQWRRIESDVGYLRIAQFDEGPAAIARLDSAFAALGDLPGLVVDVRGNPGGTLGVAMRLGDHLLPARTPVGTFTTQHRSTPIDYSGYEVDEFLKLLRQNGAVRLVSGGRVSRPYRGRLALLIDEHCGSTTEAFAAVLGELHLATLVGRRTAGAMLSSTELELGGDWILRFPEADFRTPSGRRIEGQGVEPDVIAARHWYRDSQLQAAVTIVRHSR